MQASLERLRKRREEEGDEGGFTLIELLIVIVILGILAAIVVFAVQNLTSSSSQASCSSDYKTVETAIEAFKAETGVYPADPGLAGNWTVTLGTIGAGYPAAANQTTMGQLLGTAVPVAGPATDKIGPWLKDTPVNPGHYAISVTTPATAGADATVQVLNAAGAVQGGVGVAGCDTVS